MRVYFNLQPSLRIIPLYLQSSFDSVLGVFRVTLAAATKLVIFLVFVISSDPFDTFAMLGTAVSAFYLSNVATSNKTLLGSEAIVYTIWELTSHKRYSSCGPYKITITTSGNDSSNSNNAVIQFLTNTN